jgi:DNA-binding beta-propeller fold protein YncE
MRPVRLALLVLTAWGAGLCQPGNAPGAAIHAGAVSHRLLPEWPLPATTAAGAPAGPWNFGQVAAVAISTRGTVLVLHRGAHPILEFESGGKFLRSWGEGMFSEGKVVRVAPADRAPGASGYSAVYGPAGCHNCGVHSIRVDPDGNIWVVDAAGHVVYKMNQQGRVMLQLGRRGSSGTGPTQFNLPTDVAFAPNGDVYVSDVYANPRVVKYSRDGKYLLQWGTRGSGPGEFQLPHNLVVDAQGRVYVTDRDNQRVEVFDANGKFLKQWATETGVSTLFLTKDQKIWAGGVLRDLDGKVLARLPEVGGHGTAVSDSGDVYLAQLSGKVQKFVKQ